MSPDALISRSLIQNVLARHSRGVDRADHALLASAYWPDAEVDYGFHIGPAGPLVDLLVAAQAAAPMSTHHSSNIEIRLSADGRRAHAETYVIARIDDAGMHRTVYGRYLDRLEAREGEWRICHRTYVMDANTNQPAGRHPVVPPLLDSQFLPCGGKGASDPARAMLAHHHALSHDKRKTPPMDHGAAALDAALSRDAIRRLLTGYCRGVDRADKALLASVFWPDSAVVSGLVNDSGPVFADLIIDYVTANLESCFHSIANEWIEVSGDHAVGEHYILAHMTAGGQDVLTGGRYLDRYERRGGEWRIAARTFVADWNMSQPKSMELDGMYEPLKTRGAFGPGDPVHAHWKGL